MILGAFRGLAAVAGGLNSVPSTHIWVADSVTPVLEDPSSGF